MSFGSIASLAGGGLMKKLMVPLICVAVIAGCMVLKTILNNASASGAGQVEIIRQADAAAATRGELRRAQAGAVALQNALQNRENRLRSAWDENAGLEARLGESERTAAALAQENANLLEPLPPAEPVACPASCLIAIPLAE